MAGPALDFAGIAAEEAVAHPHARHRHLLGDAVDRNPRPARIEVVGRADERDLRWDGVDGRLDGQRLAVLEPRVILRRDGDRRRPVFEAPAARVDLHAQDLLRGAPGVRPRVQDDVLAVLSDRDGDGPDAALAVRDGQAQGLGLADGRDIVLEDDGGLLEFEHRVERPDAGSRQCDHDGGGNQVHPVHGSLFPRENGLAVRTAPETPPIIPGLRKFSSPITARKSLHSLTIRAIWYMGKMVPGIGHKAKGKGASAPDSSVAATRGSSTSGGMPPFRGRMG